MTKKLKDEVKFTKIEKKVLTKTIHARWGQNVENLSSNSFSYYFVYT